MESNDIEQDHDQDMMTTEEKLQALSRLSASISDINSIPEPDFEEFYKLYNDYMILQNDNLRMLKRLNYYKDVNESLYLKVESLKAYLTEINSRIEETNKRIKLFDQLNTYLSRHEQYNSVRRHSPNE